MSWGPNANNPDNRVMPKWARGSNYPRGPLLYVCGHLCAVGTELYGCKPGGEKPVLSDLARKGMVEVFFPCQECEESRAWVWEKEVRKWVANANMNLVGSGARAPEAVVVGAAAVGRAAPVVAGVPAAVVGAPVVATATPIVTAAPVVGAAPVVATAAPVATAPTPVIATAPQQQQQQQLEEHMQLAREIEQLELEKKWLQEELQKVSSSSK